MLSIFGKGHSETCAGLGRRELLRIGALGVGSLSLPGLLEVQARAGAGNASLRGKSVVLLFLHGGPPHIEFFDPKMSAASEFHSITGEVQTTIPGVTFGGTFPKLAQLADEISIVRSFGSKNARHTYDNVASGNNPVGAAMSAIYARLAGTNHERTGMPRNVHLLPESIREGLTLQRNFETKALPTVVDPGELGKTYQAFDPSGGGPLTEAMQLKVSETHFTDRRRLLQGLDQLRRRADRWRILESVDKYQQQAFEMVMRGIAGAFDLEKEDDRTLALYDTSGIFRMEDLNRYYDLHRVTNLLGHQMLLARRLCEAGCGFVTVSDCGWDYHANRNSPKGMAGMWPMGHQVDHAVSAFLQDLKNRGLQDEILLLVTGEMGRTPRINRNGGRDHYGELTTLLVAGGGLRMGQVIGQSDRTASRPSTDPYDPRHLLGTVMNCLFDVGQLRLDSTVPTKLAKIVTDSQYIGPLFG